MSQGGQGAVGDQIGRPIDVLQHGLEQVEALLDPVGDRAPLLLAQDQRQGPERPGPLLVLAEDAVGDAGVADMPGGEVEARLGLAPGIFGEFAQEAQPVVPRPSHAVEQLVGNAGDGAVALQPLGQPPRRRHVEVREGLAADVQINRHAAS